MKKVLLFVIVMALGLTACSQGNYIEKTNILENQEDALKMHFIWFNGRLYPIFYLETQTEKD